MKTALEILAPYLEKILRHTEIVEKDNAIIAMEKFASQFSGFVWFNINESTPPDYERVLYWDSRDKGNVEIGYFVPTQSKIPDYITHWAKSPTKP